MAVWTLVAKTCLTPLGWWATYWAWVGTASHSQLTRNEPMLVVAFSEMPVLRQRRLEANSSLALPGGTVTGKPLASLSPTYITPKIWFSGMLGPTRPPGGALGSPGSAPLSRKVVVELSGLSSAVPALPSRPSASSAVPLIPSGPQSLSLIVPLAAEPPPSTVL